MNQMSDWIQANWFEAGSLVAQFTFLLSAVWFARKILKSLRISQEQMGALLRLSLSDELGEPTKTDAPIAVTDAPALGATSYVPAAPRTPTSYAAVPPAAPTHNSTPYVAAPTTSTFGSTPYVAAPLTLPEEEHGGSRLAAAGRGVVGWLQTPMKTNGVSPLRRVIRWLQTPAGTKAASS